MPITKTIVIDANTKDAQKELEIINQMLEQQDEILDSLEKELRDYEKQLDKTSSKDLNKRKQIQESINKTKKLIKEEKQDIKENTKARNKANKALDEAKENAGDLTGVMELADKATGGLASSLVNVAKGTGGVTKGFKTMKVAIAATGIGLLVIAIGAVATALTNSEAGQNKFNKMMTQIGVVVGNVTDILGNFGNAIMSFVTGNFDEAAESISKVTEGIKNFGEETKKEIAIAGELADKRAKADKQERKLLLERAEANRRIAELREKAADKENVTTQERIAAITEAGRIEEEITNKEIENARLRFEAKKQENALSESKKEDLDEEAQLEAELINLQTARLTKQKALTAEVTTAKREQVADLKAITDKDIADKKLADDKVISDKAIADKKIIDDAKILADLKLQIRDAEAVTEDERRELEIIKVTEHYDKLIALAKAQGLATQQLEEAKTNALNGYNKEVATNEIKWSDMTQKQKLDIAKQGFNNMATILGEETAAGKAAAIASATISTFESAQSSYKSLAGIPIIGPALGAAAAGAAIVSGFKQIKAITATKVPQLGGKGAATIGSGSTPSAPQISTPPSFNVVGQNATSQLAGAIGGQSQEPIKAYVVSNDITTAQGLERNIVEGATI